MMKKMLCVLLAMLLCPVLATAEESAAGLLTSQELAAWAESYIARARAAETVNSPADSQTPEGYEFIYDFATLYADTPTLDEDTTVSAIVLTSEEEEGPRGVTVNSSLDAVLDAYYSENPTLRGNRESAVLYAVDRLPDSAAWGQVLRDGIQPYFKKPVFHAAAGVRFEIAKLGNDAGAYGTFKLVLDAFG